MKFSSVITLSSSRTADPASAGIDRFVGLEHIEPENLHIRSWGLVADGTTFTSTFKRGQVLFGKRRAYQRKVAVADFDGVCSSDIYVFESKDPNVLLPELVPFICQSEGFYDYAVKTSAGSLSPRTNWSHLANYEFPLPPVDEQRRIADLLWALENTIWNYMELHESTEKLSKSYLYRWLSVINNRFEFGDFPYKSNFSRVGDITPCIVPGRNKPKSFTGEIPWVTTSDITSTILDSSVVANKLDKKELNGAGGKTVPSGTVLMTCVGELGITTVVKEEVSFNQQIQAFAPKNDIVPEYLVFALRAQKRQMLSRAATTTVPYLNKDNCDSLVIPYPDKDIQIEVGNYLLNLENVSREILGHLGKLKAIKQNLLSSTFE